MNGENHTHKPGLKSNCKMKDFSDYGSDSQTGPGSTAPTICDAHSFLPLFM